MSKESKAIYKHEEQRWNPDTGEMTYDSQYTIKAINNEDDYVKVYRYLNTVFAFKGIKSALIPTLLEITNYMSYADKGQKVILIKPIKEEISQALNIGIPQIDRNIAALKKADILRPLGRSVYAVNPFIVGRGKWSDIKELRAQFDFDEGLVTTQSVVTDKITGEVMAKITYEVKNDSAQIPGQMSFLDGEEEEEKSEDYTTITP